MSDIDNIKTPSEDVSQEGEFVPKKAYADVSQDMHKFKNKLKETEAMLNQLKAEKAMAEEQSLKDNEQWKTLYEKSKGELDGLASARAAEKDQFVNFHKKNAVIREIGGFKKDEYNSFINVQSVEMDESGNIVQDSLSAEVNRLKQSYPELIKGSQSQNLPSEAPKSFSATDKDYNSLSQQERSDLKTRLMLESKKK
jgi:hypothetical protein